MLAEDILSFTIIAQPSVLYYTGLIFQITEFSAASVVAQVLIISSFIQLPMTAYSKSLGGSPYVGVITLLLCVGCWLINVKYFLSWEYFDRWPTNFKFSFKKCTYYLEILVTAISEGKKVDDE